MSTRPLPVGPPLMGPPPPPPPPHGRLVAFAIIPKVPALLSIAGSLYIIIDSVRKWDRDVAIYHRLLIGLSVFDIMTSLGILAGTMAFPVGTERSWGAMGNIATCEAAGFFVQGGSAAVMYSASLSIYYLLRIRFGWTQRKLLRVEPLLHAIPITFGVSTMIAGLVLDLYNPGPFDCNVHRLPGCVHNYDPYVPPCTRGDHAFVLEFAFDMGVKFLCIFVVTINMFVIYWGMRKKEQQSSRFLFTGQTTASSSTDTASLPNNRRKNIAPSVRLARQSYFYVGVLYLTFSPPAIGRILHAAEAGLPFIVLASAITVPLQGFWNCVVYVRPRYLLARERKQRRLELERSRMALRDNVAAMRPNPSKGIPNTVNQGDSQGVQGKGEVDGENGDCRIDELNGEWGGSQDDDYDGAGRPFNIEDREFALAADKPDNCAIIEEGLEIDNDTSS